MSDIINLDFGYDDNVRRSINKAKLAIDSRINDYTGIKNELNRTECETGYLSTANSYINKKINSLQGKYDRLNSFETAVNNFNDFAEDQDKLVANRIKEETKSFCKRERIPNGPLYTIGAIFSDGLEYLKGKVTSVLETIKNGLVNAWETVKDWYEKNKQWIDIVVDAICVVAAVIGTVAAIVALVVGTATGITAILGIIFAAWGVATSCTDLIYDSEAYGAYKDGDMETYESLSSKNLGDWLGDKVPGGEYLYYGMEVASAVYDITKLGNTVVDVCKGKNAANLLDLVGVKGGYKVTDAVDKASKIADITSGKTNLIKIITKADVIVTDIKFGVKLGQNWIKDGFGKGTIKSIKITNSGYKIVTNGEHFIGQSFSPINILSGPAFNLAPLAL